MSFYKYIMGQERFWIGLDTKYINLILLTGDCSTPHFRCTLCR